MVKTNTRMSATQELNNFFRSIDEGDKRYREKVEIDLHQIHGNELEKLISVKQITDIQRRFIYEFHFASMELRMMGKDPTVSYRKGIRHICKNFNKNFNKNINEKMETLLKLVKDYNMCENSQLKLFINCVSAFANNVNITVDDVDSFITNWCEEIKSEEKIIINNNLL